MENLELLELYIQNKLSAEKAALVSKRLREDSGFAIKHKELSILAETIRRSHTRENIKAIHNKKLEEWAQEKTVAFKPKTVKIFSFYKISGLVAAACLIAALYLGNAPLKLPDTLLLKERTASGSNTLPKNDVSFKYLEAQQLLADGLNTEAAAAFNALKGNTSLNTYYQDAAQWYEVVALSESDPKKAKQMLDIIDQDKNFTYHISWVEDLKMRLRLLF